MGTDLEVKDYVVLPSGTRGRIMCVDTTYQDSFMVRATNGPSKGEVLSFPASVLKLSRKNPDRPILYGRASTSFNQEEAKLFDHIMKLAQSGQLLVKGNHSLRRRPEFLGLLKKAQSLKQRTEKRGA